MLQNLGGFFPRSCGQGRPPGAFRPTAAASRPRRTFPRSPTHRPAANRLHATDLRCPPSSPNGTHQAPIFLLEKGVDGSAPAMNLPGWSLSEVRNHTRHGTVSENSGNREPMASLRDRACARRGAGQRDGHRRGRAGCAVAVPGPRQPPQGMVPLGHVSAP